MAALLANPWLVVVVPFVLAAVIALLGQQGRKAAPWLASVGPLAVLGLSSSVISAAAFTEANVGPWTSQLAARGGFTWIAAGEAVIRIGWALDTLTGAMLGVVGLVALCVVIFSAGYMAGEAGWNRYFALLSLFCGSMSLLVIADSFAGLFVGWELVGACSYLLIGFWYQKPSAAAAAVKAFITTRVGDVGLLVGLGIVWWLVGSLDYEAVVASIPALPVAWLAPAAILIAVGAIGKSAQFPLHAWLPDAMEGPTPVSALIHAATMVAAGVFLVVRVWPLFEAAPAARMLLLFVGAVSAAGASLAAVAQRDIKKVLAYSTIGQLGFMFCALGAGAWVAAFFHLVTHAAFKALLFLGSGSVIHGSGTQDLHKMGNLRQTMPVTFVTWLIGVLALVGTPGLAGFFSKDAVLEAVWHAAPPVGVLLFAASGLTALYAARTTRLAFFGPASADLHAHESPPSMLVPLALLAVPSLALGWLGSNLAVALGSEAEPLAVGVSAAAVVLALAGGAIGWRSAKHPRSDKAIGVRLGRVWPWLRNAYGWDNLVDRLVVGPTVTACRALWAWGDRLVADGAAEGLAGMARAGGSALSRLQTGDAQLYALAIAVGLAVMFIATTVLGR